MISNKIHRDYPSTINDERRSQIRREIARNTSGNRAVQKALDAIDARADYWVESGTPKTLLQVSNDHKTIKGEKFGYLTGILYMSPGQEAGGRNLCPYASPECLKLCLNTAGLGGVYQSIQEARIRKARFWLEKTDEFLEVIRADIRKLERQAKAEGKIPVVRLNGTSDIRWEKTGIMEEFPHIQFYDYTKFPAAHRTLPANYHLTYSYSEVEEAALRSDEWNALGVNTAVVFAVKPGNPLPATFRGRPVIDGDESDLRFLDAPGSIVGLRAKGDARGSLSDFVQWPD
jgi:hypothetical protein